MSMLRDPVTSSDHILGDFDAPATLVEYGDFECGFCAMAHPVVTRVLKHFGPRKLRFVFRHFPLTQTHPLAEPAAESSEFCALYDRFWPAHDAIYDNQPRLSIPFLLGLVRALDLDDQAAREALETDQLAPKVKAQFRGGIFSGVNGTPTFFINGIRHDAPVEHLVSAIEDALHPRPSRVFIST